ncbi:unnamed protein product [Meloidogyne enterolobii]|uniref:Uncharacterized protein n=1 Tax=Meloidogyne enterolobii TaxID=390850 RepID=A0ACB1B7E6_MELEN
MAVVILTMMTVGYYSKAGEYLFPFFNWINRRCPIPRGYLFNRHITS